MSIFPERFVRTRNSDGSTSNSEIYTLESWSNLGCLGVTIVLFVLALIGPFLPAVILLYYSYKIIYDSFFLPIVSFFVASYFLYDIHKKWIINDLICTIYSVDFLNDVKAIAISSIIISIAYIFWNNLFYKICFSNRFFFFIFTFSVLILTYSAVSSLI
jgi:hypothetical protein